MKHLFGTTALAALLATSALAQSTTTTDTAPKADQTMKSGSDQMAGDDAWMKSTIASGDMEILVSDLIGHNIYTRDAGDTAAPAGSWDAVAEPREDWRDLGEVDDVLMSTDGKIDAIVSDVGGFLGMGEREVRITLDNLAFVPDTDDEGEFFVVFKGDPARFGEEAIYDRTVAADAGYDYLAITDHGVDLAINGSTAEQMLEHREHIERVQADYPDMTIMWGCELNIGAKGGLDDAQVKAWTRFGIGVATVVAIVLASQIQSVVQLWYMWGGAIVGALLLPVASSYGLLPLRAGNRWVVGSMAGAFALSFALLVYGIRTQNPFLDVQVGETSFNLGTLLPGLALSALVLGVGEWLARRPEHA